MLARRRLAGIAVLRADISAGPRLTKISQSRHVQQGRSKSDLRIFDRPDFDVGQSPLDLVEEGDFPDPGYTYEPELMRLFTWAVYEGGADKEEGTGSSHRDERGALRRLEWPRGSRYPGSGSSNEADHDYGESQRKMHKGKGKMI